MSQDYDDEIRANAKMFAELEINLQQAEEKLKTAQREYDAAKSAVQNIKLATAKCVGRNLRRRVINISQGQVVVITYESENLTTVELHETL